MSEYVWMLSDIKSFKNSFIQDGIIYKTDHDIDIKNPKLLLLNGNSYVNNFGYSGMPIIQHFFDAEKNESYSIPKGLLIILNDNIGYAKYGRYWIQFNILENKHIKDCIKVVDEIV